MNTNLVAQELGEAVVHLNAIVAELRREQVAPDEEGLARELGHVLNHLCCAWHFRDLNDDEMDQMPQEQFDRISSSVPNFDFEFVLLSGRDVE